MERGTSDLIQARRAQGKTRPKTKDFLVHKKIWRTNCDFEQELPVCFDSGTSSHCRQQKANRRNDSTFRQSKLRHFTVESRDESEFITSFRFLTGTGRCNKARNPVGNRSNQWNKSTLQEKKVWKGNFKGYCSRDVRENESREGKPVNADFV